MGQSVEEATIVDWLKQEGDTVAVGDPIFTIQTDKAEIECESTEAGVIRKILVQAGVEVPVFTVVALVGDANEALPDLSAYSTGASATATAAASSETSTQSVPSTVSTSSTQSIPSIAPSPQSAVSP